MTVLCSLDALCQAVDSSLRLRDDVERCTACDAAATRSGSCDPANRRDQGRPRAGIFAGFALRWVASILLTVPVRDRMTIESVVASSAV